MPQNKKNKNTKLTFAEHIYELRKRLMWSLLFVALGAALGYVLNDHIVNLLQQPLGERLYYTNPTGAFSFIIKVCCIFGFIVSLPVVMYQAFGFFEPIVPVKTRRSLVGYVFTSVMLAVAGISFAYFISLPAALHFLVNFGGQAGDIQALITADEYFNFVLAYIAGFAVLFQLPLVIIFINKVTPLKPKKLLGGTRYVILASFIVSAIITPTPDPMNQALMAGPIILLYFISVFIVAISNAASKRRSKAKASVPEMLMNGIEELLHEDPKPLEAVFETPLPAAKQQMPKFSVPVNTSVSRSPATLRPMRHRRFVDGMIAPTVRQSSPVQINRSQPIRQRQVIADTVTRPPRQVVRMGVISDFVTIAE